MSIESMNLQSMFEALSSGSMKAHSELGTRDESKQTRNFGVRIQKLKTVTGLNARLLVMKDVVIPFNPFTLEEDEMYSRRSPFRPILLVSQTLEGIMDYCKNSPEHAELWKKKLPSVDMGDASTTVQQVYTAFKAAGYIQPRIMTYHTVAMNFGGAHGFPEFRVKYTVDSTELNDDNTYDYGPSAPIWHKAAVFFNGLLKPEADAKKKALELQGASKEQISKERSAVYSKSPVGFVGPTNLVPFFYFPYNTEVKTYEPGDKKAIEETLRFYSYTDKWFVALKEAQENVMYDADIDFYDFWIKTPSSKDQKSNGTVYTDDDSMELYTAMQITNTDGRLALHGGNTQTAQGLVANEILYESFINAAKAYFLESQTQSSTEGGETFEKIMAASNRFRPITSALDAFLPACNEVFTSLFATSKHFTEDYKKAHSDFFIQMNPANAVALAAIDDDELEDAAANAAADVGALIADAAPDEDYTDLGTLEIQGV